MKPGVEIFATEDDSLDYQWDEFHLFRNEDGELFADRDSGCSCDNYEPPSPEAWQQLAPALRAQVIAQFNDWATFMSPLNKTRELERLIVALNGK